MSSTKVEADASSLSLMVPSSASTVIEGIWATGDIILVVGDPTESPARLRVSSTQLINASSTFKAMLEGPDEPQSQEISLPNDHAPTMRILMSIVHHQNDRVPSFLPMSKVLKVTKAAVKYDCTMAVTFVAKTWYNAIETSSPHNLPLITQVALVTSALLLKDSLSFRRFTHMIISEHPWSVKVLINMFVRQAREAVRINVVFRLVVAMDNQRARAFKSLESGLSAIPAQLVLNIPGLSVNGKRHIMNVIFDFVFSMSNLRNLCGFGFMTIRQSVVLLRGFDARERLADTGANVVLGTASVLDAAVAQVNGSACGVCLQCLCGDRDSPEDCAEHMA